MRKKNNKPNESALVPQKAGEGLPEEWPFSNTYKKLPENIDLLGERMEWILEQDAKSHFAKGAILLKVQTLALKNTQTFALFLRDHCGGMSRRAAFYYMAFARKCSELKNTREFGEKSWAKVITLMNSFTDEQLKEIEEKGINGKALMDYVYVPSRDFQKIIKGYKEQIQNADKDAEKKYQTIIDALKDQNEAYSALIKEKPGMTKLDKRLGIAIGYLEKYIGALSGCAFEEAEIEDIDAVSKIESHIKRAHSLIVHFAEKWEAHKKGDIQT